MVDQSSPARDRRGLTILDAAECLARIRQEPMGRVAFTHEDEVVILPVNHALMDRRIAFQTTWGSKLQVAADGGRMAFEVDGHDAEQASGWSVLVQGSAAIIRDPDERARLEALTPLTWAPMADNMFWVVITPGTVAGREIHPARHA